MKAKILLFFLFFTSFLYAQEKKFQINWNDGKQLSVADQSFIVSGFDDEHFHYSDQTVKFLAQWKVQTSYQTFKLTNVVYEDVASSTLKNIDLKRIPQELTYSIVSTKAREQMMAVLELQPIVKGNGGFKRVVSFEVEEVLSGRNQVQNNFSSTAAEITNSVLATGDWYKFYVEKTGVHKISKNFLSSLGMDVNNVDPRTIKIYGHGGQMLPLLNQENSHYDPPQNSIKVIGEQDGTFDDQDYILFYAESTLGYSQENRTHIHAYADRSYYYITAGGENGNRINVAAQPSGNPDVNISTFDDYQFYEVDEYNFALMGRRWYGDRFDVQNERTYTFEFPNIVATEPVRVKVFAAAASQISTSMNVWVNNTQVGSFTINGFSQYSLGENAQASLQTFSNSENVDVRIRYYNNGNPASKAFLDFISVEAKRNLEMEGEQLAFTYKDAASLSGIGKYSIQNAGSVSEVWDVTDIYSVSSYQNNSSGSIFSFQTHLGEHRNYVALLPSDYYEPMQDANPRIANQNLKGNIFNSPQGSFEDVDFLIITTNALAQQAERLAAFRQQHDGIRSKVVTLDKIYAEFSTGKPDIVAIRNFIKYVYDNASTPANRLKYVALFGDASVDNKNRLENNNNIVPSFHNLDTAGISLVNSLVTDDFFGMMDPNEGTMGSSDRLDLAMGRILADTPQNAKTAVDKIIQYDQKEAYGRWRNNIVVISDDAADSGEFTSFIVHTDDLANDIVQNEPAFNVIKIHADAYEQESSAGGDRYPDVNEAINDAVEVGALVVNYFGHGGESGLAHERILTQTDIMNWSNNEKFPLFITVTCEFTKFDNPLRISAGEVLVNSAAGGSPAMISTTREIYISHGKTINDALMSHLFDYENEEEDISIAEALRRTKNDVSNLGRRIVAYFGDPSMKLAIPQPSIRLTKINDVSIESSTDTLKALSRVRLAGEVVSPNGNLLSNYNGILAATVFDKEVERQTLGNDGVQGSNGNLLKLDFTTLGEIIYRGQASVANGLFEFEFVVPKDISMPVGEGRVSFYAEKNNELEDQKGYNNSIKIGGINEDAPEDNQGPIIHLYMNDENFVSGGITNDSPFILAKLEDENGINTASGIGHDIVAIIDGDEANPYILNDYYETEVDDFTKGTANYKLRDLEPGLHTLSFKAWDVYNNSSTAEIQFLVAGDDELSITRVLNYPNPFHNYTEFWFNHNRPFEPLEVQVQVFTVTGKVVWTQNQVINTDGFLSREISWDGKDDFGDAIGKGVYVYKLTVRSTVTNKKVEKFEKLVIL